MAVQVEPSAQGGTQGAIGGGSTSPPNASNLEDSEQVVRHRESQSEAPLTPPTGDMTSPDDIIRKPSFVELLTPGREGQGKTGSNDVSKQQSEVLKRDFTGLLNTVNSLNAAVFISGPVPPVRGGDERFSRLFALNKWLISACTDHSVHFINNFNIFWERRHLFKANGFNFNKSGVKLFTSNLFYSIRHPCVLGAKAEINEELSHKEEQTVLREQTKPSRNLEEELHLPPPGKSLRKETHLRQEEGSLLASNSLNNTNDQDQGPRPSPVPQTRDRPSPSSPSLSPSSPHLKFTEEMMERVNAGLRSTPQPNPFLSPINPPPEQPKVHHRAPPSTEQSKLHCAASLPLVPPYHLHALSPQSDV
ncbi:unnamed protein product [Oreochromis niloticus]|nr:unnamed protein product [Mustela putorius furo]